MRQRLLSEGILPEGAESVGYGVNFTPNKIDSRTFPQPGYHDQWQSVNLAGRAVENRRIL
jgi:hypothetical protein